MSDLIEEINLESYIEKLEQEIERKNHQLLRCMTSTIINPFDLFEHFGFLREIKCEINQKQLRDLFNQHKVKCSWSLFLFLISKSGVKRRIYRNTLIYSFHLIIDQHEIIRSLNY